MDSDDYSTDDGGKKRRAINEAQDTCERSRKTQRTPTKVNIQEEDKLDQILKMMKEMKTDQKEIKSEIQNIRLEQNDFREEIRQLKKENETLRKENEAIKKENVEIKEELVEIKKNVEWLEKENNRNNIIMSGLEMDTNDPSVLKERVSNFVNQQLKIDINVKTVKKMGQKTCLVQLENESDKLKVMKNKSKLRDLRDKVFINNCLTKGEREKQKQIRIVCQEEREKGKMVKIGYNKIIIDGTEWRWNKNKERLEKNQKN